MSNFRGVRRVVEAARGAGYTREGFGKIVDGTLFSEAEAGFLSYLSSSLGDPEKRALLFDIFESHTQEPFPLGELIPVLSDLARMRKFRRDVGRLEGDEFRFLSFAVRYIEDWFYAGKWTDIPKREDGKESLYLAVPAGIINTLAKIHRIPGYADKIDGLHRPRLYTFLEGVDDFSDSFFHSFRNNTHRSEINLDGVERAFSASRGYMHTILTQGHANRPLYFLKNCLIAREMMRRRREEHTGTHVFIPDETIPRVNTYEEFDFSPTPEEGSGLYTTMHYATRAMPYCHFVNEYLWRERIGNQQDPSAE